MDNNYYTLFIIDPNVENYNNAYTTIFNIIKEITDIILNNERIYNKCWRFRQKEIGI